MTGKEEDVAEELLGSVRSPLKRGDLPPPYEELRSELPDADYAAWVFCRGCGTVSPCLKSALPEVLGKEAPEDWTHRYISATGCEFCGGELREPRVEKIPSS